jgi:AhpD family alkylhydroperoxidase
MRLSTLDHGHRRRAKLFLTLTSAMSRVESPDIVKLLLYRPGFLTGPLLELAAEAMRGPSFWTAGEREYLAMSTAQLLQCPFCIDSHAELTRIASAGDIDPDDPTSTRPELRAARAFLTTITPVPHRADAAAITDLPAQAVVEALHVHLVFGIIARLANAFGFTLRNGQLHSGTRALHRASYRFPHFLVADGETARHGDVVDNIRHSVLDARAVTDPKLRAAAARGDELPEPWRAYPSTVRDASYRITDTDVERLVAADCTEDEIFEVTVAAAVGAAMDGYDAGRRALAHRSTR